MIASSTFAIENLSQRPNETVTYIADFTGRLRASETLASGAAVSKLSGTGTPTIANVAINSSDVVDAADHTTPANKGVIFTVSGLTASSTADNEYVFVAIATTSSGDVREVPCKVTATLR